MEKTKKPIYKRWWFYLIIALVVVVLGIIIGVTAGGSNDDKTPNVSDENNVTDDDNSDKDDNKLLQYTVDDEIKVGSFTYTINTVADSKFFIAGSESIQTENNFIVISITITNSGTATELINAHNMTVVNGDMKYTPQYYSSELSPYYTLEAGLSKTFNFVFEVPNKTSEVEYHLQIKQVKEIADIKLQEKAKQH